MTLGMIAIFYGSCGIAVCISYGVWYRIMHYAEYLLMGMVMING